MNKHFKLQHNTNFKLKQNDCEIIKSNLPGTEVGNCIKITESNLSFNNYDNYDNYDDTEIYNDDDSSLDTILQLDQNENVESFEYIQNKSYFDAELKEQHTGICGLIGIAFQLNLNSTIQTSLQETKFHMDVCDFIMQLTDIKKENFLKILNTTQMTNFITTRIPRSINDIRSFYTNNKHSIISNMPIPDVFEFNNHACVSIKGLVTNVLVLQNNNVLFPSCLHTTLDINNQSLLTTQKARDILEEVYNGNNHDAKPHVLFLVIWSDDFEINRTRKNKSSTWLKTLTFVSTDTNSCDESLTYAICIGSKNSSHDNVNKLFDDELHDLGSAHNFYVVHQSQEVPVVVRVLVMSADCPERNALNNLLSYTGASSKRWRYSSLIDPYRLASCSHCF